jgi:hypothetical protein
MIPIFEQRTGKGVGHTERSFSQRFEVLCREHLQEGRARAFAFIFYDFLDEDFRRILKDQGVFAKLDRLAGSNLSIFYLHSGGRDAVQRFNSEFLSRLGVQTEVALPCVVFFKFKDEQIIELSAVHLESADLIHGFYELYGVIEKYVSDSSREPPVQPKYLYWVKSGTKFISVELFRAVLRTALAGWM